MEGLQHIWNGLKDVFGVPRTVLTEEERRELDRRRGELERRLDRVRLDDLRRREEDR